MMDLGKLKLHTKFEVASFSRCRMLKRNPQILGSYLAHGHIHYLFWLHLMMGLGKSQLHAKFNVADFIDYYGNIKEYVEIGFCWVGYFGAKY